MRFPTSGISFLLYSIVPHRSNTMVAHNPVMTSINQHSAFHPFFPGSSRMFPADPSHALIAAGSLPPAFFSRPPQDLVATFPPSPVLFHPGLPAFLHTAPFHPHLPKHVRGSNLEERLADNGPKKCHLCEKSYSRMSTLRLHMRAHSGEKPYQCLVCLKSFSQAANLTAHFRIHSGEKPFKCRICDRRFSQSSSVTTHMRTHNGERPYKCKVCCKAFADSSTLTKHTRTHTGEKPYQCNICFQRFSQSGNLNRHKRIHDVRDEI